MRVIIRPEAELDLADAQLWYEAEHPGLGAEFRASVGHAISLMASHPLMFPVVLREVRRALLVRFPYGLYYLPEPKQIVVLACMHAKRNPRLVRGTIKLRKP